MSSETIRKEAWPSEGLGRMAVCLSCQALPEIAFEILTTEVSLALLYEAVKIAGGRVSGARLPENAWLLEQLLCDPEQYTEWNPASVPLLEKPLQ